MRITRVELHEPVRELYGAEGSITLALEHGDCSLSVAEPGGDCRWIDRARGGARSAASCPVLGG